MTADEKRLMDALREAAKNLMSWSGNEIESSVLTAHIVGPTKETSR